MGHRKTSSASLGGQKFQREKHQSAETVVGRSEAPTLGQGASNNDSGAGGNDIGSYGDASEQLDAERAALLRSKQAELDAIEDRHDDLVSSSLLHCALPQRGLVALHACLRSLSADYVATRGIPFRTVDDLGYV
jgi:hypothetical protein